MAQSYNTNQAGGKVASQFVDDTDDNYEKESSLSKTIGNVMNLVNDGLYRIKNRAKAE